MDFTTQYRVNWHHIYQTASRYISTEYHKGITWLRSSYNRAYSQLPVIQAVLKRHILYSFNTGKNFLWSHQKWVMGSAMVGVALLIIHYIRKNRPQLPVIRMASTLDVAQLYIEVPKERQVPPKVTLTFCIDTSDSMDKKERIVAKEEGRIDAVKRALGEILNNAQQVVNRSDGSRVSIAISGFNEDSRIITPPTKLIGSVSNKAEDSLISSIQTVKKQINELKCGGGTKILKGLEGAIKQLKEMVSKNKQSSHTVVLLTDGEDNIDQNELVSIQEELASTSAQLFAIGIGERHSKETLRKIVTSQKGGFKGTYIDTASGSDTIEGAISKIYQQAVASFHGLELTTAQLAPNEWSISGVSSKVENGHKKCDLGALAEGKTLIKHIQIHSDQLKAPFDLSELIFSLTFTDPKGRKGTVRLPWNPDTIIRPIILAAKK